MQDACRVSRREWLRWRRSRSPGFRRGSLIAWGLSNGTFSVTQLCQRAKARGYEWLCLEIDDYGNQGWWPQFRDGCIFHGLMYGVWVTDGWNLAMTPADAQFVIAEVEGPGDYDGLIGSTTPTIPHAIITNFSPFWDHGRDPSPLISRGWYCITEAYIGDNPNATPDNLNVAAKNLGWSTSQPAFGVHNKPLSAYDQWSSWPGCDYLGEYIFHS